MATEPWRGTSRSVKAASTRIARVELFEYRRALDGRSWNPVSRWQERRAPLLRITAGDGAVGIAEAWSDQVRIADVFTRAGEFAARILGADASEIATLHARLWPTGREAAGHAANPPDWVSAALASAVDIALWDMRARRRGVPLRALLGGDDSRVRVYASGGLYGDGKDAAALAAEMAGYARRGFTAFKMKIGALGLAADLERVRAVQQAVGPGAEIIVDAVGSLTEATAPAWFTGLHALGVRAIQAPLPATDLDGMAALQRRGPLDIIAQEAEFRPHAFQALLARGAVGWLQFNPALAGGITQALVLIAQARARGVPVTLQCHATAVLQATCLQVATVPGVRSAEFHMFHDHLHALLPPAMTTLQEGGLRLGAEPGLGIDPGFLDRPIPDTGTLARVLAIPD